PRPLAPVSQFLNCARSDERSGLNCIRRGLPFPNSARGRLACDGPRSRVRQSSSLARAPTASALASTMMEQVTLERSNMDPSTSQRDDTGELRAGMASDQAGCLYDTRTRPMFDDLAGQGDARRLEVFPALRWCAYRIQRFMQAEADRYGLTDGAARVLMQLKHAGEEPLGALAAGMHVSPKNITLLMDQLEKDGLVLRVPDPADRRSVRAR